MNEVCKNLIPVLIEQGIKFHMRKGLRRGCLCTYCQDKVLATYRVGTAHYTIRDQARWTARLTLRTAQEVELDR